MQKNRPKKERWNNPADDIISSTPDDWEETVMKNKIFNGNNKHIFKRKLYTCPTESNKKGYSIKKTTVSFRPQRVLQPSKVQ